MSSAKRTNTVAIIGAGEMGAAVGRRMRETKPPIDLNRGPRPRGHYPKTAIGFTEEEDLKQLADSLGSFIDRGLPVSVKEIQNKFGLEQPDPDELILQPMEKLSGQPPASAGLTRRSGSGRTCRKPGRAPGAGALSSLHAF